MANKPNLDRLTDIPDPDDARAMIRWMSVLAENTARMVGWLSSIDARLEVTTSWRADVDTRLALGADNFEQQQRDIRENRATIREVAGHVERLRIRLGVNGDGDGPLADRNRPVIEDVKARGVTWRDAFMILSGLLFPIITGIIIWLITDVLPSIGPMMEPLQ